MLFFYFWSLFYNFFFSIWCGNFRKDALYLITRPLTSVAARRASAVLAKTDYLHKSRGMNSERFVDNHVQIRHLVKKIIRWWFLQIMRKTFKCHLDRSTRLSCLAELTSRIDKNREFELMFSIALHLFIMADDVVQSLKNPNQPSWFWFQHDRTKFDPP